MSNKTELLPPSSTIQRVMPWLLLLLGLQLVLLWGGGALPLRPLVQGALVIAAVFAIGVALFPVRSKWLISTIDRYPQRRVSRVAVALGAIGGAIAYLYWTATRQGRAFAPAYHDEFSYLLQARMLLSGRLWMPSPPAADWFESFQVISQPVYASIYFPGAAVFYAVGLGAQLPGWCVALLAAGICVCMFAAIARMLFAPWAGWVAAIALIALPMFRLQSIMVMAQLPLLVCGLGATLLWLRWHRSPALLSAIGVGALLGLAAITRPVDSLCFAIPIAAAMLVRVTRCRAPGPSDAPHARARAYHVIAAAVAVLPALAIQLTFNRGVTGSYFRTPFSLYAEQTFPGTEYGFHRYDPSARPTSPLPQKQAYYDADVRPLLQRHTPAEAARTWADQRLRQLFLEGLPHAVILALLPAGVLLLRRVEVAVAVSPLALLPLLYWPYAFFLPHYALTVAPAVILLALAGIVAVSQAAGRHGSAGTVGLAIAVVALSIVELPEFNRANFDEFFETPQLRRIDRTLASLPQGERAIVLFTYGATNNPQEEPVYNVEHAVLLNHRIIRAHDMPKRNAKLLRQLPAGERGRMVYRYNRADDSITRLGTVEQLLGTQPGDERI